ncbi:OmpA/MotB family protein [Formosa agariphila KMM 3901]|uniref:OmpA/MotB family protein n=2 Tax=Formosa TaxID=225842 RepID=T2KJ70_FORAG|nr:OmpA/MotB family protein [Formosa agariphila KMM 3901]
MLFVFFVALTYATYSQNSKITEIPDITEMDSTRVSSWIIGIGFNAVDDTGTVFDDVFDVNEGWNAVPYPSRLSFGRYYKSGLGLEGIFTYNRYKAGKLVDNFPLEEDANYFGLDTRLSYDLNKIIGETGWFDPYVGAGVGFTSANKKSRGTINAVVGFRIWFTENFGMDVNSTGKWGMNQNYKNHKQHAIGLVYRFIDEKELSRKNQKLLALQEELALEQIKIEDSIALVNQQQEEALLLAQQAAKQKEDEAEQARLVQLEQDKLEAKNMVQGEIDSLENLYFAFDSYQLTNTSKTELNKLIGILNTYPEITLEITSHTDSRGSRAYNQTLSESRLKSTLDYLFDNSIDEDRIEGKAFGEDQLINSCNDGTKCSEEMHKANRRSEINIVKF